MNKFLNIGILAHVDAGKTTLTEQLLYYAGSIRQLGFVDKGNTQTDWLEIERQRGISVRNATAELQYKDVTVNLIDTPGHADFFSEVEYSLRVLDCALLVISALEGIQPQTERIFQALLKMHIPTLVFINKIDRSGCDPKQVFQSLPEQLQGQFYAFNDFENAGTSQVTCTKRTQPDESLVEIINDDSLIESFLNEEQINFEDMKPLMINAVHERRLFPVLYGSSKFSVGIEQLLDVLTDYFVYPSTETSEVSGAVFKIDFDKTVGKLAYIKLFGGTIHARDYIYLQESDKEEKVSLIRKYFGKKFVDVPPLCQGDIGVLCGLEQAKCGDTIGKLPIQKHALMTPLINVQVVPQNDQDFPALIEALEKLTFQDPHLEMVWIRESRELHIKIVGTMQMEAIKSMLFERFGLNADLINPTVIYQETPAKACRGFASYTMPKPCWAIVDLAIEPLPVGSGIEYASEIKEKQIPYRYQNHIETSVHDTLKQGLLGWNVTDLKITLVGRRKPSDSYPSA